MKLEFQTHKLDLVNAWTIARTQAVGTLTTMVVTLTNKSGVIGFGEAAPIERYGDSIDNVKDFLSRIDPNRLYDNDIVSSECYLHSVARGNMAAKCAVSVGLHDLAAKRASKPLHSFLDLPFREGCHLTSYTIGIDSPEVVRAKVLAASTYPVLKMKMGVPGDKANLAALREAAPAKVVRVDANEGWATKELALDMIEWLASDGNIQFIEQPMPASAKPQDWMWLKQRSPLPIFADESHHLAEDAERSAECFHGVNVKLAKTGGIRGAIESLRAARRCGLKTMLGCMIETSVLISAAAHLAELCDYLDLDGNLLITNDPYVGVSARAGILSFADAPEKLGLRASKRSA